MAKKNNNGRNALATRAGNVDLAILDSNPQDVLAAVRANVGEAGLSAMDLERIKIPSGGGIAWEVPTLEGVEAQTTFDGVIIWHRQGRVYWSQEIGAGAGTPPDCSSDDCVTGRGDPGGACAVCPMAEFGTARAGEGRGQACKQIWQLFVLRPQDRIPVCVSAPPSSLRAVKQYMLKLVNVGKPYYSVLTRFKLAKAQNKDGIAYAQMLLECAAQLSDDQATFFADLSSSLQPLLRRHEVGAEDYAASE